MKKLIAGLAGRVLHGNVVSLADIVWQYAANFGVAFLGAAFVLALGRFLGAAAFGVYAIVAATPAVVNAILDYRLQEVTIVLLNKQDGGQHSANVRVLYRLDFFVKLLSLLIASAAGYGIAMAYGLHVGIGLAVCAALTLFLAKASNATAMGIFRQAGRIKVYAILQSLDWAFRVLLLVAVYFAGRLDLGAAFYVQLAPALLFNVITIVMSWRICKRDLGLDLTGATREHIGTFLRENRTLLLSSQTISSVDAVVKELDTLVCGAFLSSQSVAVYKMAKSISTIAWKFVDPIFVVILPGVSRYIASGRIDELSRIVRKSTGMLFAVAGLLFVCSWAGAVVLSYVVLGESFAQVPLVYPFISIWIVFALPFIWTHSVAIASGNAPLQAMAGAAGNFAGLVALTIGAATFGVYGAAVGLSVAFAAPFVLSFYLLTKKKIVQW